MTGRHLRVTGALLPLFFLLLASCSKDQAEHVLDEASRAGRTAASFPAAVPDIVNGDH